jgi:sensor histidine kinase YesM
VILEHRKSLNTEILPAPDGNKWRFWQRELPQLLCINTVIATLLYCLDTQTSFWLQLLTANCVGCCIWLLSQLGQKLLPAKTSLLRIQLFTVLPGLFIGLKMAALLGAPDFFQLNVQTPELASRSLLFSLLVTFIAAAFVLQHYQSQQYRIRLEQHKRQLAEVSASENQAQLMLLQAQIEPHFLFNTLATVLSLIEPQPQQAQQMLLHLNSYLRSSLQRTREPLVTLKDEIELIEHLLWIAKIRLSSRLEYQLQIEPKLLQMPFPPLLLQPLVENAIRHAVEPSLTPVKLQIFSQQEGGILRLVVLDNGPGLQSDSPNPGNGLGLENVRQRLHQLYQGKASLKLYAIQPHGCMAELSLPAFSMLLPTEAMNHANSTAC